MKTERCAVCNLQNKMQLGTDIIELVQIRLIDPSRMQQVNISDGSVYVCQYCKAGFPFDIESVLNASRGATERDRRVAVMKRFVETYIKDVWISHKIPTYHELCHVLNLARVKTPQGNNWEYHNLMQTMTRLNMNRTQMMGTRILAEEDELAEELSGAAARIRQEIDRADAYMHGESEASYEARLATARADVAAKRIVDVFDKDGPLGMPNDMPGQ